MLSEARSSEGSAYHEVASLLSSKIREVRKAKGLTIQQLAHQVGMGAGMLSLYENGRMGRSIDRQIQILLALGLSRNDIASTIQLREAEDPEQKYGKLLGVLGRKLREVRHNRGMTLANMAEKLGMDKGSLSRLETRPDASAIQEQIRALLALGVSLRELGLTIADPER